MRFLFWRHTVSLIGMRFSFSRFWEGCKDEWSWVCVGSCVSSRLIQDGRLLLSPQGRRERVAVGKGKCEDAVRALSHLSAQRHCGFLSCLQCAVSKFTLGMAKGRGISDYLGVYPWLAVTRQIVPASKYCRMFQHWQKGVKAWPRGWKDSRKDLPRLTGRI